VTEREFSKPMDMKRWPPRSPDLTPLDLDFFLWVYVKDQVYSQSTEDTELKARITTATYECYKRYVTARPASVPEVGLIPSYRRRSL
jgi:hypothetical protein